mmetsp:Transcript_21207/g.49331  ORF Transcript_21207/g.49331 Transcript_21207/m.49331 type:complete len:90 (+) Transcript_21207:144-413(+)
MKEDASSPASIRANKSATSIISGQSGRERVDSHGNRITKGSKTHRCSFRDEQDQSQGIHDVQEVTAYKQPYLGGDYGSDDQQCCSCTLM